MRGIRAVVALTVACLALAVLRGALAQLLEPLPLTVERAIENALDDLQEDWEEQLEAALGPVEWREALGSLDGTWEGTVAVIAATDDTPARFWHVGDRPELQIVVARDQALVRVKAGDWRALDISGGFRAVDLTGGGFVYAVQSANGWVENWNLSVAKQDPDTLLVFLSFVAGRSLERLDTGDGEFAVGAVGELKRKAK